MCPERFNANLERAPRMFGEIGWYRGFFESRPLEGRDFCFYIREKRQDGTTASNQNSSNRQIQKFYKLEIGRYLVIGI
jgi:hypothetical protein